METRGGGDRDQRRRPAASERTTGTTQAAPLQWKGTAAPALERGDWARITTDSRRKKRREEGASQLAR
eukprot:7591173-Pyramimonas_sp.AAC.1